MLIDLKRRKARGGRGIIPPNPSQWENEHNGLDLRDDLGLDHLAPLGPLLAFTLCPDVHVVAHGQIPAAAKFVNYLRRDGNASWSALSIRIPDGPELVIFNDSHPTTRLNATLMEEFFHIRLGHARSLVRLIAGLTDGRSYNGEIERAAYGSGAAALVPFLGLRTMIAGGETVREIARHYQVSIELVRYRMKVTKLYTRRRAQASRKATQIIVRADEA